MRSRVVGVILLLGVLSASIVTVAANGNLYRTAIESFIAQEGKTVLTRSVPLGIFSASDSFGNKVHHVNFMKVTATTIEENAQTKKGVRLFMSSSQTPPDLVGIGWLDMDEIPPVIKMLTYIQSASKDNNATISHATRDGIVFHYQMGDTVYPFSIQCQSQVRPTNLVASFFKTSLIGPIRNALEAALKE